MKRVTLLMIGLLMISTAFFSSCSKESRIEKNLWNNGGEWNIESLVSSQTSTNPMDNFNETIYNLGSFIFKEDGTGTYTFTVDGDVETGTYTYSNTEDKLTLIVDNDARIFSIDEWEKDLMTISIIENFTSDGESITYSEKLTLKKK